MNTFQKRLAFFLSALLLASAFCQTLQAQAPAAEDARIARLAGLAKVWGTMKYFHPFLAYREIDWDKALVETIPKVNAAKTAQDYQTALNQMLAVLNDKSTRAVIETETKPNSPAPLDAAKLVRSENGVLIIESTQIAKAVANDISALNKLVTRVNESLPKATSVIFDARGTTKATEIEAYYFDNFLRQALAGMLDGTVVLGSTRYRMHNGYATQVASGANFYYSALLNSSPQTITGRSKTKTPPIVFIINRNSPAFADILSGMQAAGRAIVVQEGEQPASETFTIDLPEGVKVRMRIVELVNPDGSIDLQPDVAITTGTADDAALKQAIQALQEKRVSQRQNSGSSPGKAQTTQKDQPYAEMVFPNNEYRLLALFRYWNVVNYFFPYKHLIGDSWESVLHRYIRKFEANKDTVDYQLTVRELVTEMRDSHGGLRNANAASEKFGTHLPPVLMGYIEEKSVVTKVFDNKLPIKIGDVVLAVDGEPVEKRREFLARYTAASTPQWLMRGVHGRLLLGP